MSTFDYSDEGMPFKCKVVRRNILVEYNGGPRFVLSLPFSEEYNTKNAAYTADASPHTPANLQYPSRQNEPGEQGDNCR